ncbi:MAG: sugar phosphate isomerase/epimerase [Victivallaceae bacterium]|nr:sugar phosphate isomerase/epimerase [Victivallaceae bacterium]
MQIGTIVESLKLPLFDGLKKAAELGAEGVQIYAVARNGHNLLEYSPGQLRELKNRCEDNGLRITAICGDLGGYGFRQLNGNKERVDLSKRIIDIALELGTNIMTTHIGVVPEDKSEPMYSIMAESLREVGEYAAGAGAYLAIETGPESPEALKDFIEKAVRGKGIAVNMDPANLIMVQNADPVAAVHLLKDHIVHTHAKDGIHIQDCNPEKVYTAFAEGGFKQLVAQTGDLFKETPLGQGEVNWKEYIQALRDIGYKGFLTIEREVGKNPINDIGSAIKFLNKIL